MAFEVMFQPVQIGKLTIHNHVLSIAHAKIYATNGGMTTERYVKYYEGKAKGGTGLAICGGSSVVAIDSPQQWWSSVNLSTDRIIPHFQNLADAMHRHGAKIMIQITHMGRRSRWDGYHWPTLMSPSGIRESVHRTTYKTIEVEEIWWAIGNYAQAVRRTKEGGLDGIELFVAHQCMIDQFWSPRVGKRIDKWDGGFEGRMKFGLEVLKAVRAEVGEDFCVGTRICGDEFHPDGLSHEDMKQITKYYSDIGMLDFIGVVDSGYDIHNTLANVTPNMTFPPEPFLHLAVGIKEVVDVPVLHAQNIKDPNQTTRILEGGYVDMVGITRVHIADPYLITKVKMGQVDQIKQCVGANYYTDRQYQGLDMLCIQNAAASREYMGVPHIIEKSAGPKHRMVVVGGGPAGMGVAHVAAERGHDVTLFGKKEQLGGQITTAAKVLQRDQIADITRWYQLELARLGIGLRLGTAVDPETILDLRPDVVVLANGRHPFLEQDEHWGAADGLMVSSWDVFDGTVELGKNVLVYDTICEFSGMSVTDFLTDKGAQVEIVTDDIKPGVAIGGTTSPTYYRSMYLKEVIMTGDLTLEKVYREGDKLVTVLENEYTGAREERVVDQVVVENGVRPDESLYYALRQGSRNKGQIDVRALFTIQPQPCLDWPGEGYLLFRIDDCVTQRNIHVAIYDALRLYKDF